MQGLLHQGAQLPLRFLAREGALSQVGIAHALVPDERAAVVDAHVEYGCFKAEILHLQVVVLACVGEDAIETDNHEAASAAPSAWDRLSQRAKNELPTR